MPPKKKAPTPKKKKEKVYNDKGECCTWDGDSQDAKDLRDYVENGQCDGLTPATIVKKFPQFKVYAYQTFASALDNARKRVDTQIRHRARNILKKTTTMERK